jgi:putative peptide zinc metalloprotease protein
MGITAEVAASPAPPVRPRAEILRRADGIELIGEFEDSGFRHPPLLARRADGQIVQLTELLYAVAEASDGHRDVQAVADAVSERCGRKVTADNAVFLAERKLRPLGVLALADGTTPALDKRAPLMALRHRKPLLSERTVNAGARALTWLHLPFVAVPVVLTLVALDVWLFGVHGVAGGLRSALYNPVLLLAVLASVVVATAFHEFGHASACRYGGARPGVMGVGLYLVWPAFYCDVTDAYRLNRAGRLRTDLGGVYFNAIFALLAGAVFFITGEEAALLAVVLQHVIMLQQLLPLLRFDGYYVLTDLAGVPDILSRIKPIFRSLVRGREREPRVAELKPWVRVVVTAYLVTLLPALLFLFAWMIMATPRLIATAHDSFGLQLDRIDDATGLAEVAVGALRLMALLLPIAAMSLSVGRIGRMAGRGLMRWSRGSVPRTAVTALCAAVLVGGAGYIWWPNGDYEPIRPGERGTIGESLAAMADAAGGRPFFTPERELRYESIPTERESEATQSVRPRGERSGGKGRSDGAAPRSARDASDGAAGRDAGGFDQSPRLAEDGRAWPERFDTNGSDYMSDGSGLPPPGPGEATAQPGTTTTQPAPSSTTTQPAPSDTGTTTAGEPAPTGTDATAAAPTDTTPTTTEPTTTETTPTTTVTTDTTATEPAPGSTDTSTTTAPTTESDPTMPTTTTTSPAP